MNHTCLEFWISDLRFTRLPSKRRAESAATLLTQQFNVPAENLTSQGYGEQYLKEQTDGPSAINRRVTIRNITPLLNGGQASLPPPPPGTAPPR